jgi:hypothetical protein
MSAVPPELLGPEARRFVVLERGPELWRILDRYYERIDYVRFSAHAFAIAPVTREFEQRHPDPAGIRATIIRRLDNIIRHIDPAADTIRPSAQLIAIAERPVEERPPEPDAGYLWNLYLGRTP